jgi:hypothetical protein
MVEGKNEDISTIELSGGARIHYIFQSIFVKSLEVRILLLCGLIGSFIMLHGSIYHIRVITSI